MKVRCYTPEQLRAKIPDMTNALIADVMEQILEAHNNGNTKTRIYLEGGGNFKEVHAHFTKLGYKLSGPSGCDQSDIANESWMCSWAIETEDEDYL